MSASRGRAVQPIDRLSADEKDKLLDLASQLVKGGRLTSVTAYGSKVAGYARPDSDYDIIVTAPKFPGRIRYKYVDTPVRASALIVEDDLFQGDARKASLGEFVSGRLLNVHQNILNEEFVREAEVESKRRVIAESLLEISNQYGEFSQDLVIPFDYFLFDKLHKRAQIYPPALYSYVKTYTCDLAPENLASTLDGFHEASKMLATQRFVEVDDGSVRLVSERLRSKTFAKLLALFNLTSRGVRQYAVHGYAGRVGLSVVKDEALSKVKRMQQKTEPPEELTQPKSLLRLDEGFVVSGTTEAIQRLADLRGFKDYTYKRKTLGEVYSTARIVTLKGTEEVDYVFKHFADIRSMKWAFLNIWSLSMKFSMSPQARMHREYNASVKLRSAGIQTPRILGAAIDDKVLVRDFVKGETLSKIIDEVLKGRSSDVSDVRAYGKVLGNVHAAGFALGDSKAENVIMNGEEAWITDLEQAIEDGDQAWDIAEFLYYTGKLSLKEDGLRVVADAFLDGYAEVNGKGGIITKARTAKYLTPFRALVTPQILRAIRESFDAHSAE
jgi:tRNA A-37 threonylcarbamoyl transferase component Bud32/predicted nucleotidyltransferase